MRKLKTFLKIYLWYPLMKCCFFLLPLKSNKIFAISYEGDNYGCSPRAISDYILSREKGKFQVVWALKEPERYFLPKEIIKVKTKSYRCYFHYYTSKIIINNKRAGREFLKKPGQFYIQTWHSTMGFKQIEKEAEDQLSRSYISNAKRDSAMIDLLLSGSQASTERFQRCFYYSGEIMESGIPRNDILFHHTKEQIIDIKRNLEIEPITRVLLYAPTFRKNKSIAIYELDEEALLDSLRSRYASDWKILYRLHPNIAAKAGELRVGRNALDVTSYDNLSELLMISDILITDFSSIAFDYLLMEKPCILYAPDMKTYIQEERRLVFNLEELPFYYTDKFSEVIRYLNSFDYGLYRDRVSQFMSNTVKSYEDGDACRKVVERIKNETGVQ